MAAFKTTIHHNNFTAVGKGWNVTEANKRAVAMHVGLCEANNTDDWEMLDYLAKEARSARRGGVGEVKWRIDRDKSFIIVERC